MSHFVTGYAQPGKAKSRLVLEAFTEGCAGRVVESMELEEGTAAFYGVVRLESLYRQARARGDWIYCDNAFLDVVRGTHFRAARNRLQDGAGKPDWARFKEMGIEVKPWRKDGRHIVVVMQSEHFMKEVVGWPHGAVGWQQDVLHRIKKSTDRPILVRHWSSNKAERAKTLANDLQNAWALVTHASAAANEALLAGVPVFVTEDCAASPMAGEWNIDAPFYPEDREAWAAGLAAKMWTLEEMRAGDAWRSLNE